MKRIVHGVVIAGFVFIAQQYFGSRPIGPGFPLYFDTVEACNIAADALVNGEIVPPNTLKTHYTRSLCVDTSNGQPQPQS